MSSDLEEQFHSYTERKKKAYSESKVSRPPESRRLSETSPLLSPDNTIAHERRDKCYCARELMRSAGMSCQLINNSLEIFRLPLTRGGVAVQLHYLWPVVLLLVSVPAFIVSTLYGLFSLVLYGPVLLATVLIHEVGHVCAALWFGGDVTHIVLWPLGGLTYVSFFGERNPTADAVVAVCGPLTHILQFCIWYLLMYVSNNGEAHFNWPLDWGINFWLSLCSSAMVMQVFLFFFNLIPAYPLDGGRLLGAALGHFSFSREFVFRITAIVGSGFGWYLLLAGMSASSATQLALFTGWSEVCIALFILYNCFDLWSRGARGTTSEHAGYGTVSSGAGASATVAADRADRSGRAPAWSLFAHTTRSSSHVTSENNHAAPVVVPHAAPSAGSSAAGAGAASSAGWGGKGPGRKLGTATAAATSSTLDPHTNIV